MEVSLSELFQVTEKIFNHLRELGIDEVEIPVDYYWDIPHTQRYQIYAEPESATFTIGQIESDWAELRKLLNASVEPEPIAYQLVWLSSILRAIGEQIVR